MGRITTSEWTKMVAMYESGDYSAANIAEMFQRNASYISARLKKEKIRKGAKAFERQQIIADQMSKDEERDAALTIVKAKETNEENYQWNRNIGLAVMQALAECRPKDGKAKPWSTAANDIKALRLAAQTIAITHQNRRIAVGMDKRDILDDEELPELGIFEMNAEEIEQASGYTGDGFMDGGDENPFAGVEGAGLANMDEVDVSRLEEQIESDAGKITDEELEELSKLPPVPTTPPDVPPEQSLPTDDEMLDTFTEFDE